MARHAEENRRAEKHGDTVPRQLRSMLALSRAAATGQGVLPVLQALADMIRAELSFQVVVVFRSGWRLSVATAPYSKTSPSLNLNALASTWLMKTPDFGHTPGLRSF